MTPVPPTLAELVRPLRRGLGRLRRRVRSLLIVLGAARTTALLGAALLGLFLFDYVLRPPLWVRGGLLVALLGAGAVVVYRTLVRPLAARLDDARLATHVEAARPELEDRLRSSLAFAQATAGDFDNEDSPELMRAVVEETVSRTANLRYHEVARGAVPARWALGAGALVAVLAIAGVSRAELTRTFAQRCLLLRDVAWPRRTTLVVEEMTPGEPRRVTRGRETTIHVRAEGSLPDRVSISVWEAGTSPEESRRIELAPSAESPERFTFTMRVLTSFLFTVRGGDDDREEVYEVESLTPPSILRIEMDATYPDYLAREPETLTGGSPRVPQGTKLRLRVFPNMELESAAISVGAGAPQAMTALAPSPDGTRAYVMDLDADKGSRYSVHLVGANGERNDPGVDTFYLQVARDQPPSIRIHTPSLRAERLKDGVALIAFSARDDHRVETARLHYKINEDKVRVLALGESGGDAVRVLVPANRLPEFAPGLMAIDLARLRKDDGKPVDKGDRIEYFLDATDSAGRTQRTRVEHRIDLVDEEELTNGIQNRQQELREAVSRAQRRSLTAEDALRFVREARSEKTEFRRWTGRARASQARVIDDLGAVAGRVGSLLNVYVLNRLGDRSAADQILPFYERHLLEPLDRSGVPYRGTLYRTLWTALTERQIRASEAFAKLIEMSDLADRLSKDDAPDAYRAIDRVGTVVDDEMERALVEADESQRRVAAGIAKLDRLMKEWESFEGVVRWFKNLRERQEDIINGLEKLEQPSEKK